MAAADMCKNRMLLPRQSVADAITNLEFTFNNKIVFSVCFCIPNSLYISKIVLLCKNQGLQ